MPVTYAIEPGVGNNARACSDAQVERIDDAFRTIQDETGEAITFLKVSPGKEDISIYCAEIENENLTYSIGSEFKIATFVVTEGEAQFSHKGKVIQHGVITFYEHRNCGTFPDVEIHEILHVFGFVYREDPGSIMYPLSLVCDRDSIDSGIVEELKDIYN